MFSSEVTSANIKFYLSQRNISKILIKYKQKCIMNIHQNLGKKKSNFSTTTKSSGTTSLLPRVIKPKIRKHYNIPTAIICNDLVNTFIIMKNVGAPKDMLIPLPNKIFTWDIDNFYKRRAIQDSYYLDVLRKNPKDKLEYSKTESDFRQIIIYLGDILDAIIKKNSDHVLANMKSIIENDMIYKDIVSFYGYAIPSLGNLKYRVLILDARKKALAQKLHEKLISKLEIRTDVLLSMNFKLLKVDKFLFLFVVEEPIKYRYQINTMEGLFSANGITMELAEKKIIDETFSYWEKLNTETISTEDTENIYTHQVEVI